MGRPEAPWAGVPAWRLGRGRSRRSRSTPGESRPSGLREQAGSQWPGAYRADPTGHRRLGRAAERGTAGVHRPPCGHPRGGDLRAHPHHRRTRADLFRSAHRDEATRRQRKALRAQIAELETQKAKLADPVYIAAQARERLGFVKPETSVSGSAAAFTAAPSRARPQQQTARSNDPWYTALWHTIADTPHGPPAVEPEQPAPPDRRRPVRRSRPVRHHHRQRPVVDPADLEAVAQQLGRHPAACSRSPIAAPTATRSGQDRAAATRRHPVPDALLPDTPGVDRGRESPGIRGPDAGDDDPARAGSRPGRGISARARLVSGRAGRHRTVRYDILRWGMPDRVKCLHVLIATPWPGPRRQPVR